MNPHIAPASKRSGLAAEQPIAHSAVASPHILNAVYFHVVLIASTAGLTREHAVDHQCAG